MYGLGASVGQAHDEGRLTAALRRAHKLPTALTASVLAKPDPVALLVSPNLLTLSSSRPRTDLGWQRVVLRYKDGRVLKGFGRDFEPASGQIHVWPGLSGPSHLPITVQLAHLKAVLFAHELEGEYPIEAPDRVSTAERKITVTFTDGENLEGTTANYSADNVGFFVRPRDDQSSDERIFVVNRAVDHVQFI